MELSLFCLVSDVSVGKKQLSAVWKFDPIYSSAKFPVSDRKSLWLCHCSISFGYRLPKLLIKNPKNSSCFICFSNRLCLIDSAQLVALWWKNLGTTLTKRPIGGSKNANRIFEPFVAWGQSVPWSFLSLLESYWPEDWQRTLWESLQIRFR